MKFWDFLRVFFLNYNSDKQKMKDIQNWSELRINWEIKINIKKY